LTNIFQLILSGKTDELIDYSRGIINEIKKGSVPIEKLVISKSVKAENNYKDPDKMANVIAARQLKKLGYDVVPGMKVSYIVTDGHKVPQVVEPFIENRELENNPDWEYYTERMALTISRIAEGIVPENELDYEALVTGKQQKSLFSDDFTSPKPVMEPEPTPIPEDASGELDESDVINELESSPQVTPKSKKKKGKKRRKAKDEENGTKLDDFL
jgi:DNA polymerase I